MIGGGMSFFIFLFFLSFVCGGLVSKYFYSDFCF